MNSRLTKPLKKIDNQFVPIDFDETFHLIAQKIQSDKSNATLVFADGTLSTEELYLIQRVARGGFQSNALASFEYMDKENLFCFDKNDIVPFAELPISSHLFFLGFQPTDALFDFKKVIDIAEKHQIDYTFLDQDFFTPSFDYFTFFRAINYYILFHKKEFGFFTEGLGKNYELYKKAILQENFSTLLAQIGLQEKKLKEIIDALLTEDLPVFIFREKYFSSHAMRELVNFVMLIEKQAQTGSGAIGIKEEKNSQGLFDMGIHPQFAPGGEHWTPALVELAQSLWGVPVHTQFVNIPQRLQENDFQQLFIFGTSPIPEKLLPFLKKIPFKVIQSSVLDQRCEWADLILPTTLPEETGGLFTDSTRMPHSFHPTQTSLVKLSNIAQLSAIGQQFGLSNLMDMNEIFLEFTSFFQGGCKSAQRHFFTI